jgi:ParB family chromosome partitioning protein
MASEKTPRRLGRGLNALFNAIPEASEDPANALKEILLRDIRKNPFQPRKNFGPEGLKDLKESLNTSGLLQPITVRRAPDGEEQYELVAGERRVRAATELGWTSISAVVKELDDRELLSLALVENLQRSDLNPVEEAEGYSRLITEFSHTQQTVAALVGRDRSTIANMLRLLQLPAALLQMLRDGLLTIGHARPLLGLRDETRIITLAHEIIDKGLSARDIEQRVRENSEKPAIRERGRGRPPKVDTRPAEFRSTEEQLRRHLQTDVVLTVTPSHKGSIRISFYSLDDLERITELLGLTLNPQ